MPKKDRHLGTYSDGLGQLNTVMALGPRLHTQVLAHEKHPVQGYVLSMQQK